MGNRPKLSARLQTTAFWGLPPLFALILYWPGLMAWFQKDDFAWLGLRDLVHSPRDLLWALFAPLAQGTIRTLSERAFFLSFSTLFGLHALPYRIFVFLTAFATITMLSLVATRLTRSRAAGFCAAILWTANNSVAFVFSWTAIYYELLCALFLLTSLWLLIRYAETGERRFYLAQWATYLIGFFVLEINVVYPALALAYALCCARQITGKVLPLFVPAAIYTVVHLLTAPLMTSGPYRMFWDSSVFATFWTYCKYALGPNRLIFAHIYPSVWRSALVVVLIAGLFGFLAFTIARRQWLTTFCAAWFVIALAPVLPLRDHISDYYLTIPALGLAIWLSYGFISSWLAGGILRIAATVVLLVYLGANIPVARINSVSFFERSQAIRSLMYRVVDRTKDQPERTIVLRGVSRDLFFDVLWHRAFRLVGRDHVYLIAEDAHAIVKELEPDRVPQFFLSSAAVEEGVARRRTVVLDVSAGAPGRDR